MGEKVALQQKHSDANGRNPLDLPSGRDICVSVAQGDGHRVDNVLWQSGVGYGNVRALALQISALDGRFRSHDRDLP